MNGALIFLLGLTGVLGLLVAVRAPDRLREALALAGQQGLKLGLRIPLGLFAATIVARTIPPEVIGPLIGPESGFRGVIAGMAFGAILPGGPMVAFPLALMVWEMGAGRAQIIALLISWSVFALHRILSFEWPLMGGQFVILRLLSAWYLPLVAGTLALLLIALSEAL